MQCHFRGTCSFSLFYSSGGAAGFGHLSLSLNEREIPIEMCTFSSNFSFHISLSISITAITIILISYHRHDHGHEQLKQLRSLGTLPKRAAAAFDIIVVNPVILGNCNILKLLLIMDVIDHL